MRTFFVPNQLFNSHVNGTEIAPMNIDKTTISVMGSCQIDRSDKEISTGELCYTIYIYSLHILQPFFDAPSFPIRLDSTIYLFSAIEFDSSLLTIGVSSNTLIGPLMSIAKMLELGFMIFVPIYQFVFHDKKTPQSLESNQKV